MTFAALALATFVTFGARGAAAKGWPTPAAGESASGGPEVLLTFDDGPNPKTTPHVLDTLAQHHIHAVFFMVGEMVLLSIAPLHGGIALLLCCLANRVMSGMAGEFALMVYLYVWARGSAADPNST